MKSNLSRRDFIKAAGMTMASLAAPSLTCSKPAGKRPNILFILADDMGLIDTTLFGSEYYETPNLERLAARGMLFTNAYSASPLCSPTRASILTGKYPARLKITTPACHLPPLDPKAPLIAKRAAPNKKMITPQSRRFLRLEEYTVGEAFRDAGYETGFIGKWHLGRDEKYWPRNQGFGYDLGAPNPGPPSYFSPYKFKTIPDGPEGEYITDRVTDETVKYLQEHRDDTFMLCLWHFAVHAPFQAKEDITKKYRSRTDPRGRQDCPIMASMLQSMDESIGRVLDKLDELKIADDTIIIFMSDNGGNMYNEVEGTTPTNNYPLRGGKGNIYEGGSHVPCIIAWPGVVRPATKCDELISSVDFYPTMLEMAGIDKKDGQLFDGISIVPAIREGARLKREAIFCHFPHYVPATNNLPGTYVRKGPWKLIRSYGEGVDRSNGYELYNLVEDVGEKNNLAQKLPGKVAELDRLIDKFLADTGALVPVRNPAYSPNLRGWAPSRNCSVSTKDGVLVVKSTGNDPHISCADVPGQRGSMVVTFRMRSEARGDGQFFWADAKRRNFGAAQRISFDITHDRKWQEYSVSFEAGAALKAIRIDPGNAPGTIEFDWIRLKTGTGKTLKSWDMEGSG